MVQTALIVFSWILKTDICFSLPQNLNKIITLRPYKKEVMKFMIVYLALFALFFCIPFPLIIYLNTRESFGEPASSTLWSYIYLGVSLAIWIDVIGFSINDFLIETFRQKQSITEISKTGILRKAKVVQYQVLQYDAHKNANIISIVLSFENLRKDSDIQDLKFKNHHATF